MLRQSLQQKLQQKLSPQQIQVIKLLEVPVMELEQRIKREIEENPVLEEGAEVDEEENEEQLEDTKNDDEFTLEDYINEEDQTPSYKLKANNYSKDDKAKPIIQASETSFRELLRSQLLLQNFNDQEEQIAEFLINTLDDDGYIRRDLESVADDLAFKQNLDVDTGDVAKVLQEIKEHFDPVGVGAESLQDCLLIQLKRKEKKTFHTKVAEEILSNYFDEFSKKHYKKIIKQLEITEDDLKLAMDEIVKLNPKPGNSSGNSASKNIAVVTPDFILENNNGELYVSLNSRNTPELRLSKYYTNMLDEITINNKQTKDQKKAVNFVKQKVDSARWFIDAIKQREMTLMNTIEAIIKYQHQYFLDGDETKLKPMRLKDIAAITGLDISTISRVSNSKFIQTEFGVKQLKSFFSEGIMNEDGEEISTKEIKKILQEVIAEENKQKPLTDDKLSLLLKEKGYPIARRTVAKYREQLKIPVGRLRKEL